MWSQKVVLNEGIFKKNFIEQTQPKIKFKNIILLKFFKMLPLSVSNPGVQPHNTSWCL